MCTGGAEIHAPESGLKNPQWVSLSDSYACVLHKPDGQNTLLCWGHGNPVHQVIDLPNPVTVAVTNDIGCAQGESQKVYCWSKWDVIGNTVAAQPRGTAAVADRLCWVNTSDKLTCMPNPSTPLAPDNNIEGGGWLFTPTGLSLGGQLDTYPYVCAISDKHLLCKGDPHFISFQAHPQPQSPQGYYTIPEESAYSFRQVSVGETHVCTLQQSASGQSKVECWDYSGALKTDTPATLVNPTQVSAGSGRTCVIDEGQKKCW